MTLVHDSFGPDEDVGEILAECREDHEFDVVCYELLAVIGPPVEFTREEVLAIMYGGNVPRAAVRARATWLADAERVCVERYKMEHSHVGVFLELYAKWFAAVKENAH